MKNLMGKAEEHLVSESEKLVFDSFLAYLERLLLLIEYEEEDGDKESPVVISQMFEEYPGTWV